MSDLKTTNFSAQTPNSSPDVTSRDEEIDNILNNANQLIESVYRNMSNSRVFSPARTSTSRQRAQPQLSPRRSLNFSTDEEDSLTLRSPNTLNMDLEIARINRFCENVEQNLLPMANRRASLNNNASHLNAVASDSPILEISDATINSSTSVPSAIIDLSDSSTFITPRRLNPYRTNNEVIILDDVVDLCSPAQTPPIVNRVRRPQHNSNHSGRQTIPHTSCDAVKTSPSQPNGPHKRKHSDKASCSDNTTNDRPAYMCPVCMESPLGRAPTSTKCGHVFCAACIKQALALTHKCPMCNTKLNSRGLLRIYL